MEEFRPGFQPLDEGAKVGVFAPAGPIDPARYRAGLKLLEQRYRVATAPNLHRRTGFFAGAREERLRGLQGLLEDPSVRALFAARGGYGSVHLLADLDLSRLRRDPIPLVGFSDLTALWMALRVAGLAAIHGPVVSQLATLPAGDQQALWDLLEGRCERAPIALRPLAGGAAAGWSEVRGPLLGGNLALLASLAGTPFLPSFQEAVCFLEDVGEAPYRIDRMVMQLRLAGVLDGVAAVVLGDFTACEPPAGEEGPAALERIAVCLAPLAVPLLAGFPAGHGERNLAFVEGERVSLRESAGGGVTLSFPGARNPRGR